METIKSGRIGDSRVRSSVLSSGQREQRSGIVLQECFLGSKHCGSPAHLRAGESQVVSA